MQSSSAGFILIGTSAKDMCEELYVKPILKQKRLRAKKEHSMYESSDEPINDAFKMLDRLWMLQHH